MVRSSRRSAFWPDCCTGFRWPASGTWDTSNLGVGLVDAQALLQAPLPPAAHAAGMRVLAYPNAHYPPAAEALALADVVLESLDALTPDLVAPR